jgi:hypothetical protein
MSTLVPEQLLLLNRAAELRASGAPWAAVAAVLKVASDQLHELRTTHARAYDRLARRADNEFARETVRATLARLRELLKSTDESVAMLAAGTVIRYELARMRQEARKDRPFPRETPRWRNETPPLPSRNITASKPECDSGCDSPISRPEMPKSQVVSADPIAPKSARCDSPPASVVTPARPTPTPSAPPAPSKGKTTTVDALRRKKWLPDGLA